MKRTLVSLICILASAQLFAQSPTGTWYGTLNIQARKLAVVFHITKTDAGYSSTMDSPDQGAFGVNTDTTIVDGNSIVIEKKAIGMKYAGTYSSASEQIDGMFHQGGGSLPLVCRRTKEDAKPAPPRPQDPTDFPYVQEEITFTNAKDTVTLAGTLTMPKGGKADKIVILISGSGPQNRNEELKEMNHRPFLVWSDWLTRNGIAVLRYDDRGVAKSTGSFSRATSADFARDASAAVDYIKSRPDLQKMEVGLMGHSEGGMIAPMVAAKDKRIAFIVLLAGPGVPISELMVKQTESTQRSSAVPKEITAMNLRAAKETFEYLAANGGMSNEQMEPRLRELLKTQLTRYPADALKGTSADDVVDKQIKTFLSPWFRYFIAYRPEENLTKVKCPVLALNGSLDVQVDCTSNLNAIEAAMKKGKNKDFKIVPLTGLNHLLQKATTGDVKEYEQIAETVDPAALNEVTKWLGTR